MRPVLLVSSLTNSGADDYGVTITVTESGIPIRDVAVKCTTNKLVYDNIDAVRFERVFGVDEYTVTSIKQGESFTVNCAFLWSYLTRPDKWILVAGHPGPYHPHMGFIFKVINGDPKITTPCPAVVTFGEFSEDMSYTLHKFTAADAEFLIRYKWYGSPFFVTRVVHVVYALGPNGRNWKEAPENEPTISDPPGNGWRILIKSPSPKDFIVTARGGTYVEK
jgi:hypothetical protein